MSKIHYDALIVVEGATDKALLTSFLDSEVVITNGSDVPRGTIDYLKEASATRNIVVLTDPDAPGKRIRDELDKAIPNLLHAYIPKEKCIKKHKVGVAESSKEDILEALSHIAPSSSNKAGFLTFADLYELGLMGSEESSAKRNQLSKRFHLGECNAKTFLKRINALSLDKETLEDALHG